MNQEIPGLRLPFRSAIFILLGIVDANQLPLNSMGSETLPSIGPWIVCFGLALTTKDIENGPAYDFRRQDQNLSNLC